MASDFSELRKLIQDLGQLAPEVKAEARGVLQKGALNIKRQMQAEASATRHYNFAHRITYETKDTAGGVEAEIGPETGGVASLAGIAYFGGVNGGGGTIADPQGALDAEAPNVEKYLLAVVDKAFG